MRYFIATYVQKPDGKYSELVKLDSKIRNKDSITATLILDYQNRKVVKARVDGAIERDFDKLSNFYKGHYPQLITALESKYQALKEIQEELVGDLVKPKNDAK